MKANNAAEIIRQAIEMPVETWLDYSPQNTPLVVYDDNEFIFINHPDPPSARPEQLTAATAIEINDILTATIPSPMCDDEQSLVPLAYHECFHVYQAQTFAFDAKYNFFEVLAFYPELDYAYRALCSAETEIINDNHLPPPERVKYLSELTRKRHEILSRHTGLLAFEKDLERREGTASFIEQKARTKIYGIPPDNSACYYGYSRQYFMGAAICWLLEKLNPIDKWQVSVQKGKSLSELLFQITQQEKIDLEALDIRDKERQEQIAAETARENANQKIDHLLRDGAMKIKLPDKEVFRSFNPKSIISFGDGRLLHPEFVNIQIPNGQIAVQGDAVLEDYNRGIVICRAVPYQILDNKLEINTETVHISLSNVRQTQDQMIEVL